MKKKFLIFFMIQNFLYSEDICTVESNQLLKSLINTHPSVKMNSEAVKGAQYKVDSAKWKFYPTPSIDVSYRDSDRYQTTARLDQPLWTGGKLTSSYDIAESQKYEIIFESQETSYKLIENFYNIMQSYLQSKENLIELNEGIQNLNELKEMLERRVEAGVSSVADQELLNSRIKAVNSDIVNTKNRYLIAKMQFELLLNEKINCDIILSPLSFISYPSLEEGVDILLNFHPSLKKIDQKIKTAYFELNNVKSATMPNLNLRAEHTKGSVYTNLDASQNIVYATLSISTNAGLSAISNVESARVKIQQISFEKQTAEKDLVDSFLSDYNNYLISQSRISILESSILSAHNVLESYKRLFIAGKKQWLDLVNASRELMQYKVELSNYIANKKILEYKLALKYGQIDLLNGDIK
jgi:adhesin transport system outer membrane protein